MLLSTIALVMKGLIDAVQGVYPNLKCVYDEDLTYQTSVTKLREKFQKEEISSPIFPLFAFRRTVLRISDKVPRATNVQPIDFTATDYAKLYRGSYGMFDIEFLVYHTDMEFMESFEIEYLMWQGLKSIRDYSIFIPGLDGEFKYQTYWDWLSDIKISVPAQYYKALTGRVNIQGLFLALSSPATYPKIKEIIKTIRTLYGEFLESETIT